MFDYTYLIGSSFLMIILFVLFLLRRDLKKVILFSGLLCSPIAISDIIFTAEYWKPTILFNNPMGIESFLFCFSVGGISSVLYKIIFSKKIGSKIKYNYYRRYLLVGPVFMAVSYLFLNIGFMLAGILGMFLSALVIVVFRKDLHQEILFGSLLFTLFFFLVLFSMNTLFPNFISQWRVENLIGIFILDIPIEEILWALSFSMLWSGIYEYFYKVGIKDK